MARQQETLSLAAGAPLQADWARSSAAGYGSSRSSLKLQAALEGAGVMDSFRASPAVNMAAFIFLPWLVFTAVMCPFALGYREFRSLAWFLVAVCVGVPACLLWLGARAHVQATRHWMYLCLLCMGAAVLGMLLGLYGYYSYVTVYHTYEVSRFYLNVLPTQDPGGMIDAGMLTFSSDARVDPTRSVGYRDGDRFCAAPILSAAAGAATPGTAPQVNFWAVGRNCCRRRGLFACGPVWDSAAKAGLRVLDASPLARPEVPLYLTAVRQAAATYGLRLPEQPLLVHWAQDPEQEPEALWAAGLGFYRRAVGGYLAAVLLLGLVAALYWDAKRLRGPLAPGRVPI